MVTRRLCSILVALTMGCAGQAVQQEAVELPNTDDLAEEQVFDYVGDEHNTTYFSLWI